jgi:basic membrane protein A and related proteins
MALSDLVRFSSAGVVMTAIAVALSACAVGESTGITGSGIGVACSQNSDCHAGACVEGLCTATCTQAADCPAPSACFSGMCSIPLDVSALWLGGVSEGEGWNRTHHEGMKYAAEHVPYLRWSYEENVFASPGPLRASIDDVAKDENRVVIVNSYEQQADALAAAEAHPRTRILMGGGSMSNGRNAAAYMAHMEQAVYVAGKVAATKAKKRIGMIPALVTPQQVRETVAFALGAKSVNPNIIIEVGWLGFWLDYFDAPTFEHNGEMLFREELLSARMIESGCEVIYHGSDNQRSVRYIDKLVKSGAASNVFSIATNNREGYRQLTADGSVGAPIPTSLGAAYYNWGPLYVRLFDQMHRGTWKPSVLIEPMTSGDDSAVAFELSPVSGIDDTIVRRFIIDAAARGPDRVFEGPYVITGQRDKDRNGTPDPVQAMAAGEHLAEGEFDSMCWFVKGMVEKSDPLDPRSADVDAHVPNPGFAPPSDMLGPPGSDDGSHRTCNENL